MKILVLNGSPRPNGDTARMVGCFREAAEGFGHEVQVFEVCRMHIRGCLACEYCHGRGQGNHAAHQALITWLITHVSRD